MRGDSLRDLYAKTMAVVGLGLIACAGAVVDYWPLASPMPVVTEASVPAQPAFVLTQDLNREVPAPAAPRRPSHVDIRPGNVGSAVFLKASLPEPAVAELAIPEALTPIPLLEANLDDTLVYLMSSADLGDWAAPPPELAEAGFVSGALRKTKDSILRTGVWTGSSIADAFRGVFGAVKRKVSIF